MKIVNQYNPILLSRLNGQRIWKMTETDLSAFLNEYEKNFTTSINAFHELRKYVLPFSIYDYNAINKNLKSANIKEGSKRTVSKIIKKLFKFLQLKGFDVDPEQINCEYNAEDSNKKRAFTKRELEIIKEQTEKPTKSKFFKHNSIKRKWKILINFLFDNGARVSEAVKVLNKREFQWSDEHNIFYALDKTAKNGNARMFLMSSQDYQELCDIKPVYSISSIKTFFWRFQNHLKEVSKGEFATAFTSHAFRTNLITNNLLKGHTAEQIKLFTGHKRIDSINSNYFKANNETMLENSIAIMQSNQEIAKESLEIAKINSQTTSQMSTTTIGELFNMVRTLMKQNEELHEEIITLKKGAN